MDDKYQQLKQDLFRAILECTDPFYAWEFADHIEQECRSTVRLQDGRIATLELLDIDQIKSELVQYLRDNTQRGPLEDAFRRISRKTKPNEKVRALADAMRVTNDSPVMDGLVMIGINPPKK